MPWKSNLISCIITETPHIYTPPYFFYVVAVQYLLSTVIVSQSGISGARDRFWLLDTQISPSNFLKHFTLNPSTAKAALNNLKGNIDKTNCCVKNEPYATLPPNSTKATFLLIKITFLLLFSMECF